jgi:hypothetical protein
MNLRRTTIHAFLAGPRRTHWLLLLAGALLALVPLAGAAQAGVSDYPSPLYLAGPASSVTGHGASYRLVGTVSAAPSTAVAAGASTLSAATYRYVYTVDTGGGETASAGATATVTVANGEVVTVSGLPTGPGLTVRLYRLNIASPTSCYTRVWLSLADNAQSSFTDTNGSASCTNALKRSEDRFPVSTTGWTELSPSTTAPFIGNSAVSAAVPAAPNKRGWIVDGPGEVSFPTGPWTFEVQTRSTAADGSAALLVVAMWKVDNATGDPVGAPVLPPTEQVQAPASLITPANGLQTVSIQVDVPTFALEANERLYVQFWRHQTTPYLGTTGAANRIATMFGWDGAAKITHPVASGYAVEPTPVAPAAGASTASRALEAVFNDPDGSDSGTVEFRVCTDTAVAGSACATPVDSGSSAAVAKGATATWTIGAALTHAQTYHWQARGRDVLGGTSAWTATRSFLVNAAPGVPALLWPDPGAVGRTLALEAAYNDPDGDAGSLELRVCSTDASAGVECPSLVSTASFASLATGATARRTGEQLPDGVYHWQARATDALGAASAWSATRMLGIDTTPPGSPTALGGTVAGDGLTLRWLAPPGDDAIGNYVVYIDGKQWQVLGGQTFEAKLGPFDAADSRRFAVRAIDAAGNHGPLTDAIVGVPDLVGLTRAKARTALAARGLDLRDETAHRTPAVHPGEVVVSQEPDAPSLVATGSSIGVVLAVAPARPLLRFTKVAVVCSPQARIAASIWLRDTARVTVTLLGRRGARVASWNVRSRAAGSQRLTLRIPSSLRRPGHYRLSVAATTSGRSERLSRPLTLERATSRGRRATGAGRSPLRCARP